MKKITLLSLIIFLLSSCSDADIVSGTYEGLFYATDTTSASMKITRVADKTIRMDVINSFGNVYTEFASLTKNADQDYIIFQGDAIGTDYVNGYYQEGYIHIYTSYHDYIFEGHRK